MHFSYAVVLSREVSPLPASLAFPLRLNAVEVVWFYALHFTELWISFLANRQMVVRIRLEHTEHTRFLILWAGHKPAKEWGALSPSQGFHSPLLIGIKSLDRLVRRKQAKASWACSSLCFCIFCVTINAQCSVADMNPPAQDEAGDLEHQLLLGTS